MSYWLFISGQKYDRQVIIIAVDFTDGQSVYLKLAEQLNDLNIGVLSEWVILLANILVSNINTL